MDCVNCQRLSNDLTTLTIALKNIKKWVNEKLEIEIPRCLDYPAVAVDVNKTQRQMRLKDHNLIGECLNYKAVVKLERLSLPTNTSTTTTQNQESTTSSTDTDDYDIVNNVQKEPYRAEESELPFRIRRYVLIQNNSGEDSLPSIISDLNPNRISCQSKGPSNSSRLRTYSKRNASNQSNSYENRDLKKDLFLEKVITSTSKCNITPRPSPISSYLIEDNYIKPPQKIRKTLRSIKKENKRCLNIRKIKKTTTSLEKKDSLCTKCGKIFSCLAYLNCHIRCAHTFNAMPKVYKECPHCHKKYSKRGLTHHIQLIHAPDLKSLQRICPFCAMTFKNEKSLKQHLTTVHNEDRTKLKCSFTNCNREFYWEYQLKTHAKSHSKDIDVARPFKCTVDEKCDKSFARIDNLKTHIEKFHKNQELRYVCQYVNDMNGVVKKCCENFSSLNKLKLHNYSVHNEQNEYKCTFDGCFQSFKQERHLVRHLENFHQKTTSISNEKVISIFKKCPICLKQINISRNSTNLKKHIQFVHEGKRLYPCPFENCKKSFQSKEIFGLHVKNHHPDHFKPEDYPAPKEYSCSVCTRKFNSYSNFLQHKTVHLKVGTFSCNFCDLKFKRKPFVTYHVQAVHSGLRPFTCNYENCDKTFALKYYLTSHISQVHLGKSRTRYKLKK